MDAVPYIDTSQSAENIDYTQALKECCKYCKENNPSGKCLAFSLLSDQKLCYFWYNSLPDSSKVPRDNTYTAVSIN